jgi:tRNA A-37 threonylcarbamoyl transferase component Bud32/DNA-directed RNA polymerase specialized sigma24 family protein
MDEPSVELLARYRQGDESAATELFRRYVSRLTVLARAKMAPKILRRFDAEDVVLSAYRSFFVRARDGQFSLTSSGELWRLLVTIVLRKLYRQAAHHTADKRSVEREVALPDGGDSAWEVLRPMSGAPAVEEAVAVADLVEGFMAELEPVPRQIVEMRLQGFEIAEIAAATARSERTVGRTLEDVKHRLECLLPDADIAGGPRSAPRRAVSKDHAKYQSREPKSDPGPSIVPSFSIPDSVIDGPRPIFLSDRDFVLQLHLGTGGTGKVYRAVIKGQNQTVAVKMLKKANQRDPAAVARFLEEARIVARLDHPGIVAVKAVGRTRAGGYFLLEEFVRGQNLAEVAANRQIEVAEAMRWLADAADAIDHSHRRRVIHCDLKPANLLLDEHDRVRVTDFGLAHILNPGSQNRAAIAGTAGYMAPEQLDPSWGPISPGTDVFGLGAVLFALLTGRPPFSGKSVEFLLRAMLQGSPCLSLQRERPDVSAQLDAICGKCLALKPNDRFATAADLAQALRLIL